MQNEAPAPLLCHGADGVTIPHLSLLFMFKTSDSPVIEFFLMEKSDIPSGLIAHP